MTEVILLQEIPIGGGWKLGAPPVLLLLGGNGCPLHNRFLIAPGGKFWHFLPRLAPHARVEFANEN